MITHIALFKLVHANAETIDTARKALAGLEGKIPQLRHFEVGVNLVHSYRSYDLSVLARFDSLEDLQAYRGPEHREPAIPQPVREVANFPGALRRSASTTAAEMAREADASFTSDRLRRSCPSLRIGLRPIRARE